MTSDPLSEATSDSCIQVNYSGDANVNGLLADQPGHILVHMPQRSALCLIVQKEVKSFMSRKGPRS